MLNYLEDVIDEKQLRTIIDVFFEHFIAETTATTMGTSVYNIHYLLT